MLLVSLTCFVDSIVTSDGLEPPTCRLGNGCSIQLRYEVLCETGRARRFVYSRCQAQVRAWSRQSTYVHRMLQRASVPGMPDTPRLSSATRKVILKVLADMPPNDLVRLVVRDDLMINFIKDFVPSSHQEDWAWATASVSDEFNRRYAVPSATVSSNTGPHVQPSVSAVLGDPSSVPLVNPASSVPVVAAHPPATATVESADVRDSNEIQDL